MISIITPLYNKEKSIARTIESVIHQSYNNWELIIINDGSTDNSATIVSSYLSDKRIKYLYKDNSGVSPTRNLGINIAKGDWIICIDADDYFFPDSLEILLNTAIYSGVKIATGNFYAEKNNNRIPILSNIKEGIVKNNFKSLFFGGFDIRAGATLFKADIIKSYQYDNTLKRYEDAKFEFEILRFNKVAITPKFVMVYSQDDSGLSIPSNDISNDFINCLNFRNKSFWEKVVLGKLLAEGFTSYPEYKSYLRKKYNSDMFWMYLAIIFTKTKRMIINNNIFKD